MKRILTLAVAAVAMTMLGTNEASAQLNNNGFQYGVGFGQGFAGFGVSRSFARPPYFAEFPPVYYSGIVRRPYGISPFAAPPGIAPVELSIPSEKPSAPVTIRNPFIAPEVSPIQEIIVDTPDPAYKDSTPVMTDEPMEKKVEPQIDSEPAPQEGLSEDPDVKPAKTDAAKEKLENKTTWIKNPYYVDPVTVNSMVGLIAFNR